jgi:hypothetical protein
METDMLRLFFNSSSFQAEEFTGEALQANQG